MQFSIIFGELWLPRLGKTEPIMASKNFDKVIKLLRRYKSYVVLAIGVLVAVIVASLLIYYLVEEGHLESEVWLKFAELLMNIGETMIGTVVIGGGLGTLINFIFEEMKKEEEEAKERVKDWQDKREKNKLFRWEMQNKLQEAHDHVELARILIKSHKSGKTYGEQIRNRIMPSLISLQDFKRKLTHAEDRELVRNMDYLQVSLTYMIAYLSVLIEEFECSYLKISNLQNYQDALANRMRTLFTEVTEGKKEEAITLEKKKVFLEKAEELFGNIDIPSNIEVVWQAMGELDYIWDFIDELRNDKGQKSLYNQFFLQHYFHCLKILKTKQSSINEKMANKPQFVANMEELKRIEEKKNSDQPLTNQDSLTRKMMREELHFDFDTAKKKSV